MARIARIVVPHHPHHVIQRGNRRQRVFFCDLDKSIYLHLLRKHSEEAGIRYWAYCLMDNHVHLIAVPENEKSLSRGIGEAHRKYTLFVNSREHWRGYLWHGRFMSYPLDEKYLYAAVRYVERNPVRAGLVPNAENYAWSSARSHVFGEEDPLISDSLMLPDRGDWPAYLRQEDDQSDTLSFRRHAHTGRPLGDDRFLSKLERLTGRILIKKRPGRKPEPGRQ